MQCLDFIISPNNQFLVAVGKEGTVKVYDYFMRGSTIASFQAFTGHTKHATRVCMDRDMNYVFTIGPMNGIYKWRFYGDKEMPSDITQVYEELPKTNQIKELTADESNRDLLTYTQQ